jgi:hypothetical protein
MAHYECGTQYVGEAGRSLAAQLQEPKHSLGEGLLEESEQFQHLYEETGQVRMM